MAVFDVIKFDGANNNESWLVYKAKKENITWGSQLIVGMGQEAIFVKGGRAQDIFTPGTYTLKSGNLPMLGNLVGRAFGGNTPFTAEVVFINRTNNINLKWGTSSPINMEDPKYGLLLGLRARGAFSVKVDNTRTFINQLVGTLQLNSGFNDDIVWQKYNPLINTKFPSQLKKFMRENTLSFLEVAEYYDEISTLTFKELKKAFLDCGLELMNFLVEDVSPPKDEYEELRKRKEELVFGEDDYNKRRLLGILENTRDPEMAKIITNSVWGNRNNSSSTSTQNGNTNNSQDNSIQNNHNEMVCPSCNNTIEAGSRFCRFCGYEFPQEKFCSGCGKRLELDARFCSSCGRRCD